MNKTAIMLGVVIGAILGAGATWWLAAGESDGGSEAASGQREPLYWVAPMDANYRRDEPGQSPMGMDLVPVYEEGGAGLVSIAPEVVNNLGVRSAPVVSAPLRTDIDTVGYVRFNEDAMVHMHPRVEGWIDTLNVTAEGESVRQGQPVYSLYSPTLVNAQEELVLALQRDNAPLISSAEQRLRALQVPPVLIDRLREERQVQRTITLYAPRDGVVAELNVREGHYVQPGSAILSIGPLDEVWVIAEVFESQLPLVSAGDRATMTLDYLPGETWEGEVDFIYPTLDENSRTARMRIRLPNPERRLKPGMFAQVEIHNEDSEPTLLVPREAVIRTGAQDRVVLSLGNGRFKSVEVMLGREGDDRIEILSGLVAGDAVVTSAQFLLDSESSIDSDFQRMNPGMEMEEMGKEDMDMENMGGGEMNMTAEGEA